jgi:hypothetical protein
MPPLTHVEGGSSTCGSSIEESQVLQWISQNKDTIEHIFEIACFSGAITYDPLTQKWSGKRVPVPYHGEVLDRNGPDTFVMPKLGRPPIATVYDVVDLLNDQPTFMPVWANACCMKFGFTKRTFATLKAKALKLGLIRCEPWCTTLICYKNSGNNPAKVSADISPLTEPDAATMATVAKI